MPFGFHSWDLLIVVGIALLIFGPKRLPEMGSAVGKTYREFRKSMSEMTTGHKETSAVEVTAPAATATTQIAAESTISPDHPINS
ncbi:MAG TPA: twin-arginine translocase TatA/TatE family subunit [Ktedonobacterales bacterium]|nr:twin-arginine translocase TatA/TatE family subunit [Ktedonobacterales bacterium]